MVGAGTHKGRRVAIIGGVLVVAVAAFVVVAARHPGPALDASKLATVERGDLARSVVATGRIQPLAKVEVKSKASGIVKRLLVDYGDRVKAGQVLAELDREQLERIGADRIPQLHQVRLVIAAEHQTGLGVDPHALGGLTSDVRDQIQLPRPAPGDHLRARVHD